MRQRNKKKYSLNENEFIYLETIENFETNEFFIIQKELDMILLFYNSLILKKSFIKDNNQYYIN